MVVVGKNTKGEVIFVWTEFIDVQDVLRAEAKAKLIFVEKLEALINDINTQTLEGDAMNVNM